MGVRPFAVVLASALLVSACGGGGSTEAESTFTGSSTVTAASGMTYEVAVRAGVPRAEVQTVSPAESTLTVTMPLDVTVRNTTEGFDATVHLTSLDDARAWLPPIAGIPGTLDDRSNGLGPELSASYCDSSSGTVSPGDTIGCTYDLTWDASLSPDVAQAAAERIPSMTPVAVTVGDSLSLDWASAADATSFDAYADERAADCGYPFSRYASGQARCRFSTEIEAPLGLLAASGAQDRPTLTLRTVDEESASATATYADLEGEERLELDMIERLPTECPVAREVGQQASTSLWAPSAEVVFIVTDGDSAGLAFRAPADIATLPESVNEELVRTGAWVPNWEFENEDFDPMRKVGPGNLPFAMPTSIPGHWTPLRREYAPRIVELGNAAAMAGTGTPVSACAGEILVVLKKEERRREREAKERERNWRKYRGSGGGSFNIPGWLCPTRWC